MSGHADYESAWIAWARSVVSGDGALRVCEICQTRGDTPFDRILWPGFIGERYADGGVLFVGAMHNAKQLRTPEMEELAEFVEHWAMTAPSNALDPSRMSRACSRERSIGVVSTKCSITSGSAFIRAQASTSSGSHPRSRTRGVSISGEIDVKTRPLLAP
jgi:hypothetical protein